MRWRFVSIEVNQDERYDGFADTQALKVFPTSMARAASQRHTVHGHRKITANLDAPFVCFHKDMDQLIHAHPPRETERYGIVVWLLFKAHSGARRAARLWQEYFRNEVLMSTGWNAEAMEPNAYHEAEDLNNDDDASMYGHFDNFMVELTEHEVDIKVSTTMGIEATILRQVSSWRPAGITWVRVELRAAALTPNTAANKSDELFCDRTKARSCTKCLEHDHIERCMTKIGMMIVGAWAGEQLLVVSGTGVISGEGHIWTMGVVLLVTFGVGLLSCVCCIRSALANWKCTCDKKTRGCMAGKRHDFEKHA